MLGAVGNGRLKGYGDYEDGGQCAIGGGRAMEIVRMEGSGQYEVEGRWGV